MMRVVTMIASGVLVLGVLGCASTAPTAGQQGMTITPEAKQVIMEKGEATAAAPGESTETELICETRKKLGSHMVEQFCYTRTQAAEARRAAQESLRNSTRGGTRIDQ